MSLQPSATSPLTPKMEVLKVTAVTAFMTSLCLGIRV